MGKNSQKGELLAAEGYHYNFVRMVYVNQKKRKIFSLDAILNKPVEWVKERMNTALEGIYFNGERPGRYVIDELKKECF